MAKHDISFTLPRKTIKNADAEFAVRSDGKKLGTLKVSRGTVEWLPTNYQNGFHLTWEQFDRLMQKEGSR